MEFTRMELSNLEQNNLDNAIIVLTNGIALVKQLPKFGKTEFVVTNTDGKVTYIDEVSKTKTKL